MTPAPKRRWFRFSLRTLFVVVTVFGCWLGWNLHVVRERNRVLETVPTFAAFSDGTDGHAIPLIWSFFGAEPVGYLKFDSRGMTEKECRRIEGLFAEAKVEYRPGMSLGID